MVHDPTAPGHPFARLLRITFVALTLGAMLPVAVLNLVDTNAVLQQRAEERLLRHAEHTAARIEDELERVRQWAEGLATHPAILRGVMSPSTDTPDADVERILRNAPLRVPPRAVRLYALDGTPVAGVGPARFPDPHTWPAFTRAASGSPAFATAREGSDPATLLVPLRASGQPVGVAVVALDTESLRRFVTSDTGAVGEGSFGVLLDATSTRIVDAGATRLEGRPVAENGGTDGGAASGPDAASAAPPAEAALTAALHKLAGGRHEPTIVRFDLPETGRPGVGVVLRLSEAPWFYFLAAPTERIDAPLPAQRDRLWLGSLLGLAAALLASLVVSRRLAAPLAALETAASNLAAGNRGARAQPTGPLETRRLARVFNAMADEAEAHGARLEVAVAQRTAELEEARRDLELFTWSASHDLRSPLRTIEGFAEAIVEDFGPGLDPEALAHVNRIRATALRMSGLIDDLLALGQAGRQALSVTEVNVTGLCEAIAQTLADESPSRTVQWSIAPGLSVRGDPNLVNVVLENLLRNAFKYTGNRAQAEIWVASSPGGGVSVRDNGAGFDRAKATRLFEPFQRFHTGREFPGTGIGLATVRRIVERHGGQIHADSKPGEGATFTFSLAPPI